MKKSSTFVKFAFASKTRWVFTYLNPWSFISVSFQIPNAMLTVSGILKPFLAIFMAGLKSSFHGNFPYFFHAASIPRSSPGTATAKPPVETVYVFIFCTQAILTLRVCKSAKRAESTSYSTAKQQPSNFHVLMTNHITTKLTNPNHDQRHKCHHLTTT